MSQFIGDKIENPIVFIQWKGTDACFDFHCGECGHHDHFDTDFAYAIQCSSCGTVWEMPCYLTPRKADERTDAYWREKPKISEGAVGQ